MSETTVISNPQSEIVVIGAGLAGSEAAWQAAQAGAHVIEFPARASEQASLQRSTRSWEGYGR